MFRIVARLSRRARTMPRRSPLTSVTPALSIATSVPVPIAIPTSACASAGASLMPSPAIATTRPCCLQPLARPPPSAPAAPRPRPRRCRAARATASAVVRLSPVSITTAKPFGVQRLDRLRRRRLDRIGDADEPGRLAVDRDEHHRLPVAAQRVRRGRAAARHRRRALRQQRSVADRHAAGRRPCPRRPCPVTDSKSATVDGRDAALRAPATIAAASGCSLTCLEARGEPQQLARRRRRHAARPSRASACLR